MSIGTAAHGSHTSGLNELISEYSLTRGLMSSVVFYHNNWTACVKNNLFHFFKIFTLPSFTL